MTADYDIAIIGGGAVGAALAALVKTEPATAGWRVALLEERVPVMPAPSDPWELRVSALSRASQRLLQRCGAWPAIVARGALDYEHMRVWDAAAAPTGPGSIGFDAASMGEPDLGHITENRAVQAAAVAASVARGVDCLPERLTHLDLDGPLARLQTASGRTLSVRLVVAADGAGSIAREQAGLTTAGYDYDEHAVVATLRPARPHRSTAWQRFLPTGPLALLPLPTGEVSIVWSTRPAMADSLLAMDDAAFGAAVTEASDGVLGALVASGQRGRFPLKARHAEQYSRARFVLVGDAAHTVHPLAGQGVNLGLLDAAALVEVLADAADRTDPGDARTLARYARWRKAENAVAIQVLDAFDRLFSNEQPLLGALRRNGLTAVDHLPAVKRWLMQRALGVASDVPRLARAV